MEAQFYSFWPDVLAMALELSSLNEFRFIGRRWERHKDDGITGTGIVQERFENCVMHMMADWLPYQCSSLTEKRPD